ncbi:MAG: MoxR family ATPase [Armatimonadetes bacterium]|nr:MoxR family ATPase [Armatimonadota bacterium]
MNIEQELGWFGETFEKVRANVAQALVGQNEIVEGVLVSLAANGHVLLEGFPGLGKTLLVRSLASSLDLQFSRIQFTPDMMPADVTGTTVLTESRTFEFRKGPVFTQVLLADEINRATPKTQSSLLEAMQEKAVSVAGHRHALPDPFLVMATQNPIEQEGTYPLPEAQLDRFFFKLIVGFPDQATLRKIVTQTTGADDAPLQPVASADDVIRMRNLVRLTPIADHVLTYGLEIVSATHRESENAPESVRRYGRFGSSPRGAQSLVLAAKVFALLAGRPHVSKEDLKRAAKPALRHRILLNFDAEVDGVTTDQLLDDILASVARRDSDPVKV